MDQGFDPAALAAHVARVDPDRHMAACFAPEPARARLIALYAFDHELAQIRERVSEPLLGQIRLAWWREAIAEIYDPSMTPRRHEAVLALNAAFAGAAPPRPWIERLIDARDRELDLTPFASLDEAQAHAVKSAGTLMRVASWMLAPDATVSARAEQALSDAGAAWGLMTMARMMARNEGQGWPSLAGVGAQEAFVARASALRAQAAAAYDSVPAEIAPALLYVRLIPLWLRRIGQGGAVAAPSLLGRQARLVAASAMGRI